MDGVNTKYIDCNSKRILVRTFHGEVTFADIISSWDSCINNNYINDDVIGVISDFNDGSLMSSFSDVGFEKIIAYIKTNKTFNKLKLAVIIDSPEKIVFPIIGQEKLPERQIKPFSTEKAAVEWISKDKYTQ